MSGNTESGEYEILDGGTRQIADSAAMALSDGKRKRSLLVLLSLVAASLVALLVVPIPQDNHAFADQRTLLGIPNFWNVASNLPFIAVGAAGLLQFHRHPATIVLFLGSRLN